MMDISQAIVCIDRQGLFVRPFGPTKPNHVKRIKTKQISAHKFDLLWSIFHSAPQAHLFTLASFKLLINATFPFLSDCKSFSFPNIAVSHLFVNIVFSYKLVVSRHLIFSNIFDLSQETSVLI